MLMVNGDRKNVLLRSLSFMLNWMNVLLRSVKAYEL